MADTKISGLTALTGANAVSGDLLTIVDVSDTTMAATGTNKKITLTELQSAPVSAGTANGVLYLNGSKVATSGSALTFDGSQLDIPAGSAAAPSLSTTADPNTGMFFPAADTIAFSEGGVESLRINSSGNVGIGTTSPISKLSVHGGTGDTSATDAVLSLTRASSTGNVHSIKFVNTQKNTNYGNLVVRVKTTASGAESDAYYTDVLTIDGQNGNLVVGGTSAGARFQVTDSSSAAATALMRFVGQNTYQMDVQSVTSSNSTVGSRYNFFVNSSNGEFSWSNSGGERARIDSSGNLLVGTTSAGTGAIVDVQSTTKGVRFPNMTTTQKNAITPAAGTVVFDTTLAKLCVYSGSAWQTITSV